MSRIWFITGASRGIGAEIAKAALAAGDKVVATGRDRNRIEKTFAADADRVLAVELDVAQEAQAKAAVNAALAKFGRIDVLVNNAGYGQLGLFEENEPGDIEQQYATNVFGLFHVTRAVLPVMRQQRAGHIFNLSSVGGLISIAGGSIYCSTKFAVEGFSEGLAKEVEQFGIKVTLVEPGPFRTDFLNDSSMRFGTRPIEGYGAYPAQVRASFVERANKQPGDPVKLAQAVLVLADTEHPPLRFAAGAMAFGRIDEKLAAMRKELEKWQALTLSADFAAQAAAE
jgi:NAD(P)-dependent dehydrogenase (short-subunit alcohol dehydrogenase family)